MQLYLTKPVRPYLNVAPGSFDAVDTLYTVKIKNHATKKLKRSSFLKLLKPVLFINFNAVDCSSF